MGDGKADRCEDFSCGLGEKANHRFGHDGLVIDEREDIGERGQGVISFAGHQVMRYDEADQELSGERDVHPHPRAWLGRRREKPCRKAKVEELIEGHRQCDTQDAFVCGIVRAERRQAVEKGGGHGEILCTAGARGKAAGSNR